VVERISGCNHLQCRCGAAFCYCCGLAYRSNAPSANNVHGTSTCTCDLFAVPHEDAPGAAVAAARPPGAAAAAAPQPGHLPRGIVPAVARANVRAAAARHGYIRDGTLWRNGRRVQEHTWCMHSDSIHDCPNGTERCWFRHDEDDYYF
jgi:hypothetical protein